MKSLGKINQYTIGENIERSQPDHFYVIKSSTHIAPNCASVQQNEDRAEVCKKADGLGLFEAARREYRLGHVAYEAHVWAKPGLKRTQKKNGDARAAVSYRSGRIRRQKTDI